MAQLFDGVIPSLLQGVSQQIPRERLQGQLTTQRNMLSDLVTGIRRRPGLQRVGVVSGAVASVSSIQSKFIELDTKGWNVTLDSATGTMFVADEAYSIQSSVQDDYLVASKASALRVVVEGGYGWLLNTEKVTSTSTTDSAKLNPDSTGWFYIKTGAFGKTYSVTVASKSPLGAPISTTATYTTPDGTTAGDAAKATPEYIAEQLYNGLALSDTTFVRSGVYVSAKITGGGYSGLTVTTPSGTTYIGVSNKMNVPLQSDLPPSLPSANGFLMSVGNNRQSLQYFMWVDADKTWLEVGDYSSYTVIGNMPRRFSISNIGAITLDELEFSGRTSGDDYTNPYPYFVGRALTGMSTYQGRLVLLCGPYVNMSASDDSTRFMRSTVTQVLATDPIERGSGSATAASFTHALQYNKDLLLFSSTHQAVVPFNGSVVTPSNSVVALTGTQSVDTLAEPAVVGRGVMFSTPLSSTYFGVGELMPSDTTASQYTANELTNHVPRIIKGRCRHIVSSSAAGIALFSSDVETSKLLVHEYLWSGADKVQNAWHIWDTPLPIACMHFARDKLMIGLVAGTSLLMCSVDIKDSAYYAESVPKPMLDAASNVAVVSNTFTLPAWLRTNTDNIVCSSTVTGMEGEPIQIVSIVSNVVTLHHSYTGSTVDVGYKYSSEVGLTPPIMRDQNGFPIQLDKTTLLRYVLTTQNSGDFDVSIVTPKVTGFEDDGHVLTWASPELGLGKSRLAGQSTVIVPCRTIANETDCTISTNSTRELNIIGVEYTMKTALKRRRV